MNRAPTHDPLRCGLPAQQGVHSWGCPCKPCRNFAIGQWEAASSFCWSAPKLDGPSGLDPISTSSDQNHGKPDAVARYLAPPGTQPLLCQRHQIGTGIGCPGAGAGRSLLACFRALASKLPSPPSWTMVSHHHSPATSSHQGHVLPDLGPQVCKHEGGRAHYVATVPRHLAGSRNTAHPPGGHALGNLPVDGNGQGGRISCLRMHRTSFSSTCVARPPQPPKTGPLMPCGGCSSPHHVAQQLQRKEPFGPALRSTPPLAPASCLALACAWLVQGEPSFPSPTESRAGSRELRPPSQDRWSGARLVLVM